MNIPTYENVDRLATTLSLLGDASRLSIVIYLNDNIANVSEITNHFKLSQPTISHHLRVLKDAKIVKAQKKGKEVYYTLNNNYVKSLIESSLNEFPSGE